MTQYLIRLPWPEPALWHNNRSHWAKKAKATKRARKEAWALALERGITCIPDAILEFMFYPPTRARPDLQNMPDTQKAAIDGIADAMGCDDSQFRPRWPEQFGSIVDGGAVVVHIIPPIVSIEMRGHI